jgi:hypothetical protein
MTGERVEAGGGEHKHNTKEGRSLPNVTIDDDDYYYHYFPILGIGAVQSNTRGHGHAKDRHGHDAAIVGLESRIWRGT